MRFVDTQDAFDSIIDSRMSVKPIHFDVFLKLAIDVFSCSASGKLKTHLRKYLDKEVCMSLFHVL